jgi:hypothetical protein
MRLVAVALGFTLVAAGAAIAASYDSVEDLLEFLNSPAGKQETRLREASRDEEFTNRLNVVFEDAASPDQRIQVMRDIGGHFLAILFRSPGISTVTIVEKDAAGTILNRSVTNLIGAPGAQPSPPSETPAPAEPGD